MRKYSIAVTILTAVVVMAMVDCSARERSPWMERIRR